MAQSQDTASSKFGEDAKQKFTKYKDLINNSTNPRIDPRVEQDATLTEIIADLRRVLDSSAPGDPLTLAFLNDHFPPILKTVISRKFSDYAQHYRPLSALLCHWIQLRVGKLEHRIQGDAIVLRRIFSPHKLFYDAAGLPSPQSIFRDLDADAKDLIPALMVREAFATPAAESKVPAFAYNVNLFGQLGGFECILKILITTEAKAADLKYAKRLVKVVANMSEYMEKEQWTKRGLPIGKAALSYLSKMNDFELRQVKTAELTRLFKHLHRFFLPKPSPAPAAVGSKPVLNPVEEVELGLALRLSTFPSLERRLTGIGMLRAKMERLTQKWPEGKDPSPDTLAFAEWLRAHKFVEMLFGESIREEALKRAGDMLAFMYAWGALGGSDIADLWETARVKHDVMQTSIFQVLELTALHLSKRDAGILFDKIRQVDLAGLKENMVGMLNTLARNEYYRNKKRSRKAKKAAEEAKSKEQKEQHKQPEDTKEETKGTPAVEEQKFPEEQKGMLEEIKDPLKSHGQPSQRRQQFNQYEQKFVEFNIPSNLTGSKGSTVGHKRARDDSAPMKGKQHARTGSGDQTSLPLRSATSRANDEFEKEPFIPDEEDEGEIVADSCDVLNYIWSLTNEVAVRGGLSPSVQISLIDLFLALLSRCYRSKCIDYLHMCEGMLATDNSLNQFSRIYIKIAEMLGQDPQWKLQPTVEDLLQKLTINLIKFKRLATQKGIEQLNSEHTEEEECMDTQSSIEEKNARENDPDEDAKESSPVIENLPPPMPAHREPEVHKEKEKEQTERAVERRENVVSPRPEPSPEDRDVHLTLMTNEFMKLTYYQELEQRLELLKFLLTKGKMQLKAEHVPLLWQTMLINSFSRKEIDAFFEFMFSVIRSENGLTMVAGHVFDSFFFEILLKMDQRDYPEYAFKCLREMIIAMNISYKQMTVTPQGTYEVVDIRLIGMEAVWEVALQAHEETVRKAATEFIHEVYKRLSQDLVQKQGPVVREEFILKCMSSVKLGAEGVDREAANPDYTARIARALELLSGYIDDFETVHMGQKRKYVPDMDYNVFVNENGGAKREPMHVTSTMKLRELFESIKQKYKYPEKLDEILFIVRGKVLTPSDMMLYDADITEDVTISVSLAYKDDSTQSGSYAPAAKQELEFTEESMKAEIADLKSIFSTQTNDVILAALSKAKGNKEQAAGYLMDEFALSDLLEEAHNAENARLVKSVNTKTAKLSEMISGNDKYFSVLYQLLDSGIPAITDQAWALISKLPLNPKMQNDLLSIKTMDATTPWDKVYSLDSPFKLSYNLQVIYGIMHTGPEESRYEWITCFVLLGGFSELCNAVSLFPTQKVIDGRNANTLSPAYLRTFMQCIELALKIVKELLEGSLAGLDSECYKEYRHAAISSVKSQPQPQDGAPRSSPAGKGSETAKSSPSQTVGVSTDQEFLRQIMGPDNSAFASSGECMVATMAKEEKKLEEQKVNDAGTTTVLRDEVAQSVIGIIEHQEVVKQVVGLLAAANVDSVAKETANILKAGIEIVNDIMCSDLKGVAVLYGCREYKEYLYSALVKSANEGAKSLLVSELATLFNLYAKFGKKEWGIVPPDAFHLDLLAEMLPRPEDDLQNTEIYFGFLSGLFDLYSRPEPIACLKTKLEGLLSTLLDSTKKRLQRDCTEQRDDKQLAGYLRLLARLLDLREDSFALFKARLDFELVECLCGEMFGAETKPATATHQARKCATKSTMTSAVQLLLALAKKSPAACTQLLPRLARFHEAQVKCPYKDTGIDVETKAPGNYVGLKNFGCTCYINSLLQQLFMMPDLRYKLLQMDTKQLEKTRCDNVTANLQKIFAALLLSKHRYYPPTDFCHDFHEIDGKAINVLVQQDVDEFFNRLTEKLDVELRALGQETVLKDTMEIVLLQEISSLEPDCVYASQKEDPCLTLPLDIKGRKSIEEALDFFVKEEILEGDNKYHCERDDRLIRASKKCVLKKLPQTLILNLKRFEFNYATMQKQKLNDYCEFPCELNLYKWTYDALKGTSADSPADYEYNLVGVLVHSGTAEGGHYYSYIKEREPTSPNLGKWFEFNDTRVQPFDPADLKSLAFGSQRKSGQSYGSDANAYLLVYQKTGQVEMEGGSSKGAKEKFGTLIEQESEALTNTRIYLDTEYARFVKEFFKLWRPEIVDRFTPIDSDTCEIKKLRLQTQTALNSSAPSSSVPAEISDEDEMILTPTSGTLTMCKLAVLYANDLIVKTKAPGQFKEWTGLLIPHIRANALFSVWLIKYMTKHKDTLFEMLVECTDGDIRDLFLSALTEATRMVAQVEEPFMRQVEKFLIPSNDPNTKIEKAIPRSAIVRFASLLLSKGLSYARSNYRRFNEFFSLLTSFVMLGSNETACLINESAIYLVTDFIANTASPLKPSEMSITRPTMGEQFKETDFRAPLQLLSVLIRKCSTARTRLTGSYSKYALCGPDAAIELPESEVEFFFSTRWDYLSLIPQAKDDIVAILGHLTWEDEARIKLVIPPMVRCMIDKKLDKTYAPVVAVLKEIVMMKDTYIKQRCFTCMYTEFYNRKSIYEYLEYYRDLSEPFVLDILEFVAEIASIEKAAEMLREDKGKLQWVPDWLAKVLSRKQQDGVDQPLADMQKKARFVARCFADLLDVKKEPAEPATAPGEVAAGKKEGEAKEPEGDKSKSQPDGAPVSAPVAAETKKETSDVSMQS